MSVQRRLFFDNDHDRRDETKLTEIRATVAAWHAEERAMERHGGPQGLEAYSPEARAIDWDAHYFPRANEFI